MRRHLEQGLQTQIANYLRWALAPPAMFTAFPAGGGGEHRGKILKAMGLRAGMPDLLILHGASGYFIELKKPHGQGPSKVQEETIAALEEAGFPTKVCRSLEEVQQALVEWEIPTRIKPSRQRIKQLAADLARQGDIHVTGMQPMPRGTYCVPVSAA